MSSARHQVITNRPYLTLAAVHESGCGPHSWSPSPKGPPSSLVELRIPVWTRDARDTRPNSDLQALLGEWSRESLVEGTRSPNATLCCGRSCALSHCCIPSDIVIWPWGGTPRCGRDNTQVGE